jgi:ribosomal protein S18 acetylase RimI-like enzyme
LPKYPSLPATLLGRLARDSAFRAGGLGKILLWDACARALNQVAEVGSIALVTDPIDARADALYQQYGFRRLDERRLFFPMSEIERWIAQS